MYHQSLNFRKCNEFDFNRNILEIISSIFIVTVMTVIINIISLVLNNILELEIIEYLNGHAGATGIISSIISAIGTFIFAVLLVKYQENKNNKNNERNLIDLLIYTYTEISDWYIKGDLLRIIEKKDSRVRNLIYDKSWRNYIYTINEHSYKTKILNWIIHIEEPIINLEDEGMYDTWSEQYLELIKDINYVLREYYKQPIEEFKEDDIEKTKQSRKEDINYKGIF